MLKLVALGLRIKSRFGTVDSPYSREDLLVRSAGPLSISAVRF